MPKPDRVRCGTCVFWEQQDAGWDQDPRPVLGTCQRHAPKPMRDDDGDGWWEVSRPLLGGGDWCGEWSGVWPGTIGTVPPFYLDDEDGTGWRKVTEGQGSPWCYHRSVPVEDHSTWRADSDAPNPQGKEG